MSDRPLLTQENNEEATSLLVYTNYVLRQFCIFWGLNAYVGVNGRTRMSTRDVRVTTSLLPTSSATLLNFAVTPFSPSVSNYSQLPH